MHKSHQFLKATSVAQAIINLGRDMSGEPDLFDCFPRNIELLVNYSLEIPIIRLSDLTLQKAYRSLCILVDSSILEIPDQDDRPVYGLLHVGPPSNIIFLKDGLPTYLSNYILAHEVGHFMADIFYVRELWFKSLPEQKDAIFKIFSWQEMDGWLELRAVLKGLPPRPTTITTRGRRMNPDTSEMEIQADLIARELIAPWERVVKLFRKIDRAGLIDELHLSFGLPKRVAAYYYDDLQRCLFPAPDFVDRLFGPLLKRKDGDQNS